MTNTTIERAPLGLDEYEPEKYWYQVREDGRCMKTRWIPRYGAGRAVVECYTDVSKCSPSTDDNPGPKHWVQSPLLDIIEHARREPTFKGLPVIGVSIDESPQVIPL